MFHFIKVLISTLVACFCFSVVSRLPYLPNPTCNLKKPVIPHFPVVDCWLLSYTVRTKDLIGTVSFFHVQSLRESVCYDLRSCNKLSLEREIQKKTGLFSEKPTLSTTTKEKTHSGMVAPLLHVCQGTDVRFHSMRTSPLLMMETAWKAKQWGGYQFKKGGLITNVFVLCPQWVCVVADRERGDQQTWRGRQPGTGPAGKRHHPPRWDKTEIPHFSSLLTSVWCSPTLLFSDSHSASTAYPAHTKTNMIHIIVWY